MTLATLHVASLRLHSFKYFTEVSLRLVRGGVRADSAASGGRVEQVRSRARVSPPRINTVIRPSRDLV